MCSASPSCCSLQPLGALLAQRAHDLLLLLCLLLLLLAPPACLRPCLPAWPSACLPYSLRAPLRRSCAYLPMSLPISLPLSSCCPPPPLQTNERVAAKLMELEALRSGALRPEGEEATPAAAPAGGEAPGSAAQVRAGCSRLGGGWLLPNQKGARWGQRCTAWVPLCLLPYVELLFSQAASTSRSCMAGAWQ